MPLYCCSDGMKHQGQGGARFALSKTRLKQRPDCCAAFVGLENYSSGAAAATAPQSFVKQLISLPFLQKALPDSKFANLAAVDALYEGLITDDKGVKGVAPHPASGRVQEGAVRPLYCRGVMRQGPCHDDVWQPAVLPGQMRA